MMSRHTARRLIAAATIPVSFTLAAATAAGASSHDRSNHKGHPSVFTVHEILSGTTLTHTFTPAGTTAQVVDHLTNPDDITTFGDEIFAGFQNGVGPQGQASSDGNLDTTIVELNRSGDPLSQWDVVGKVDGLTADPAIHRLIATVNEDGNSSLYTIDTATNSMIHYAYNGALAHNGGTDAISIYKGQILISASAPGSTGLPAPQSTYPAVYAVQLVPSTQRANVTPLFGDEDMATVANLGSPQMGQSVPLALTDPDSSEIVPLGSRFGGDFMLTSQGDQEQIYVKDPGGRHQSLSVLTLSQAIDDTAWPTGAEGTLYSTDSTNDSIDTVTGPFGENQPIVIATPCGSNSAPSTCPAPNFPANYLATLDPATGQVSAVTTYGAAYTPQGGLVYMANNHESDR